MSRSRLRSENRLLPRPKRSVQWARGVCIALLVAGLLTAGSSSAQPAGSTLQWLASHSTDVVRGRVVSLESSWTEDRTQIVTEVRIAVEEVLKGDAALEVRLIQPGGQVGDIAQISPQGATFSMGEEVLVFTQPEPGARLRLVSFAEGKVGLERDERGLWVPPASQRQLVPDVRFEADATGRVRWRDFARSVRSALEEGSEAGLRRREAPSLDKLAAPASPVAGLQLETEGFHVVSPAAAMLCPSEPSPFVHWDLRQFPGCQVPYEINPNFNNPGIPVAAFVNEVHAAAAQWNSVGPSHISLVDVNQNSGCVPNLNDRLNCVGWRNNFPWGTLVGWTTLWINVPSGRILEADSFLNPNIAWRVTPNPLPNPCPMVRGIQSTFLHELGHFVGLGHSELFANPAPACGNDDPNQVTKMYSDSTYLCQINLHQADMDGINYLYTQDLGDLPDPPYPTRVHQNVNSGQTLSGVQLKTPNDGPSHLFGIYPGSVNFPRYQYEWLAFDDGAIDDHPQECEARPVDNFDDGVTFSFKCVNGRIQGLVTVLVSVRTSADVRGRSHTYNNSANNKMYLNGWFDWNGDGDFADLLEYGIGPGAGSFAVTAPGAYVFQILPPPDTPCDFASRFRLDWREDVGQILAIDNNANLSRERYAAQHGEVEDYPTPPQFPVPVYCHPKEVPVVFGDSGRTVSLMHLCHPPKVSSVSASAIPGESMFPSAGVDCMHSTMTVGIDIDFDGIADEMVGLTGDVCVNRTDPLVGPDGLRLVETEMLSLEMTGTSELAGDLHLGLAGPSFGEIRQSEEAAALGFDVSGEFPASTYFDVHFVVDSERFGTSEPVGPLRVAGEIGAVPPGEVIGEPPPGPEGDPDIDPAPLPEE